MIKMENVILPTNENGPSINESSTDIKLFEERVL